MTVKIYALFYEELREIKGEKFNCVIFSLPHNYRFFPTIPIHVASSRQVPVDNVAATLYPGDAPTQLKPVMCIGDGNCLFRAFSIILFGDEDHHTELRMRSISELAKNEDHYLDENYLLALAGASNVVKSLLPSSVNVISKDPITSFRKEVLRTVRSFTFANMWHIFSLSNALGCRVVSVYPKVENPGTNRSLLNITIQPSTPTTFLEPVNLMWSHCSDTRKKGWGPNHFVPLLSADASGSQGDT